MRGLHVILLLSTYIFSLSASAKFNGVQQTPQLQKDLKWQLTQSPDGEDVDKWNTRPIIGVLTQVRLPLLAVLLSAHHNQAEMPTLSGD